MKKIILVGKAGSGKDYFRDFLNKLINVDVSYTTRPVREGELEGYTYHYISEEEFIEKKKRDFFVEDVTFNNWRYGTSSTSWKNNLVFIKTPSGLKNFTNEERNNLVIVYFDIEEEVRRDRLLKRSDADTVERRIAADERDFRDFRDYDIRVTHPYFDCQELYEDILE